MSKEKYYPLILDNIETNYLISKRGKIYSLKTKKVLKPTEDKNGYYRIGLKVKGKSRAFRVNRLVAITFIPVPKKYTKCGLDITMLEVNHKDCDKKNNHYKNLEWCTGKENIKHAEEHGLRKHFRCDDHPMAKYSNDQIKYVCELIEENELSVTEISKITGVNFCVVASILYSDAWKDIAKDYDITSYNVKVNRHINCPLTKHDDELVHEVCQLLERGVKMKDIEKITGMPDSTIQKIKYGEIRTDISSLYDIKVRKHKEYESRK